MQYKNLNIIGTSHIAKQSINEIKDAFTKFKPDIVAVELDKARLYGLLHDVKPSRNLMNIRHFGLKGYLFALIGGIIQAKLGEIVGVKPGADMLTAVQEAGKSGARIALIDQNIEVTLKKFSDRFSWRERWNLFVDLISAPFSKEKVRIDLSKVPSSQLIKVLMEKLKDHYPNIYYTLVQERNEIMAKKLAHMLQTFPDQNILAIIGAGHELEILKLVKAENRKI
ncbi:MAG: TraB/GumN family protein [archaeon]